MMIRTYNGIAPHIADSAYIAETGVIVGDVRIGQESSIWFNAVVRGDVNVIRIGARTNVQDLAVLHVSGKKDAQNQGAPLLIGNDVTIGHSAVVHGCTVEDGAFIGMRALVMDHVIVGRGAMVAAGSLVPAGTVIPPGTLWLGSPARFSRMLSEAEQTRALDLAATYVKLAADYRQNNP